MSTTPIATNRTPDSDDRDDLIRYRPRPAEWGDVDALRELRDAKTRIAAMGADTTTLELPSLVRRPADTNRTERRRVSSTARLVGPLRRGLLSLIRQMPFHARA